MLDVAHGALHSLSVGVSMMFQMDWRRMVPGRICPSPADVVRVCDIRISEPRRIMQMLVMVQSRNGEDGVELPGGGQVQLHEVSQDEERAVSFPLAISEESFATANYVPGSDGQAVYMVVYAHDGNGQDVRRRDAYLFFRGDGGAWKKLPVSGRQLLGAFCSEGHLCVVVSHERSGYEDVMVHPFDSASGLVELSAGHKVTTLNSGGRATLGTTPFPLQRAGYFILYRGTDAPQLMYSDAWVMRGSHREGRFVVELVVHIDQPGTSVHVDDAGANARDIRGSIGGSCVQLVTDLGGGVMGGCVQSADTEAQRVVSPTQFGARRQHGSGLLVTPPAFMSIHDELFDVQIARYLGMHRGTLWFKAVAVRRAEPADHLFVIDLRMPV